MTVAEWLNLILRWTHLIAGIMWIGSSFYFIWLDSHLTAPQKPRERVEGELWMVHSGGFYQVEKRWIGPGQMPAVLHWFEWEATITWMSGFFLLGLIYYSTHGLYLVDPLVSGISPGAATGIGIGVLILSWAVYDLLWKSPLAKNIKLASVVSLVLVLLVTFGLCQVLSGRAAYIHVGAMLGTLMVANVWMRILPAQRKMIDATKRGEEPDHSLGEAARWRSVHNTYMTLPVLFTMLSIHFPGTYGSELNWLILALLMLAGAGARHLMVVRDRSRPYVYVGVAVSLVALFFLTAPPAAQRAAAVSGEEVSLASAKAVITARCISCHSEEPRDDTFGAAPGGVSFDTDAEILRRAERISYRASVTKTMPLGNITRMTMEERDLLARWAGGLRAGR